MENVQAFQEAVKQYGLPDDEIFQPVDLVEHRNISQVTVCLLALARKVLHFQVLKDFRIMFH